MTPADLPERMARKITVDDNGCWIWTAAKAKNGYGSVSHLGKVHSTHRLAYTLLVGPVPEGLQLDHAVCSVRACCNPTHLEPVTAKVNNHRAHDGYRYCKQGHDLDQTAYLHPRGNRECRICRDARRQAAQAARRVAKRVPKTLYRAICDSLGYAPADVESIVLTPGEGVTVLVETDEGIESHEYVLRDEDLDAYLRAASLKAAA